MKAVYLKPVLTISSFKCLDTHTMPMYITPIFVTEALHCVTYVCYSNDSCSESNGLHSASLLVLGRFL